MVAIPANATMRSQRTFRVGGVIEKAFAVYSRHFISISLITLVFLLVNAGSTQVTQYLLLMPNLGTPVVRLILSVGALVILISLYMTSSSIIYHIIFQYLYDGRAQISAAIKYGFGRAPAMILLGLIMMLAIVGLSAFLGGALSAIASQLFPLHYSPLLALQIEPLALLPFAVVIFLAFVPFVVLSVMWNAAAPACVAEGLGPVKSLGRSRNLTKGYRWRVFGLFLITVLIVMIPVAVTLGVTFTMRAAAQGIPMTVAIFALHCLTNAYMLALPCATYHDLRLAKEGRDIHKLATVFE